MLKWVKHDTLNLHTNTAKSRYPDDMIMTCISRLNDFSGHWKQMSLEALALLTRNSRRNLLEQSDRHLTLSIQLGLRWSMFYSLLWASLSVWWLWASQFLSISTSSIPTLQESEKFIMNLRYQGTMAMVAILLDGLHQPHLAFISCFADVVKC